MIKLIIWILGLGCRHEWEEKEVVECNKGKSYESRQSRHICKKCGALKIASYFVGLNLIDTQISE